MLEIRHLTLHENRPGIQILLRQLNIVRILRVMSRCCVIDRLICEITSAVFKLRVITLQSRVFLRIGEPGDLHPAVLRVMPLRARLFLFPGCLDVSLSCISLIHELHVPCLPWWSSELASLARIRLYKVLKRAGIGDMVGLN